MVRYPLVATVAVDIAAWAGIGVAVGYTLHRWPSDRLARDGAVTRIRAVERDGRIYERVGVRRWKDRLPEAGALFEGGVSKRSSGGRDALERFVVETRRAELTHWWVMATGPVFALWNPWPLALVMAVYGVVANLPCIVIQRFNRGRLERMLRRSAPRSPA